MMEIYMFIKLISYYVALEYCVTAINIGKIYILCRKSFKKITSDRVRQMYLLFIEKL